MKILSLIFPYYKNPNMLEYQLRIWTSYPLFVRTEVEIIIVDDGSPVGFRAAEVLRRVPVPNNVQCARIVSDLPWNHCGARNLGVHLSKSKWVMWVDMDHIVSFNLMLLMMGGICDINFSEEVIYSFGRIRHDTQEFNNPHKETRLMTRQMFDRTGWFDESFSGHYAFADREYFERIEFGKFDQKVFPGGNLERVDSDLIFDAKTHGLPRTAQRDNAAYDQIVDWKRTIGHRIEKLKLPWIIEQL